MDKYIVDKGKLFFVTKIKNGYKLISLHVPTTCYPESDILIAWARHYLDRAERRFEIEYNHNGRITTALIFRKNGDVKFATAKCNSKDDLIFPIGRAIATCRLLGDPIPKFI